MKIVWTEQAIADLEEIEHHVAQEKPSAAPRVAAHLIGTVEHLAEFPRLGKVGPRPEMRNLGVPPYTISYRVRSGSLQILGVWNGRRPPREIS